MGPRSFDGRKVGQQGLAKQVVREPEPGGGPPCHHPGPLRLVEVREHHGRIGVGDRAQHRGIDLVPQHRGHGQRLAAGEREAAQVLAERVADDVGQQRVGGQSSVEQSADLVYEQRITPGAGADGGENGGLRSTPQQGVQTGLDLRA